LMWFTQNFQTRAGGNPLLSAIIIYCLYFVMSASVWRQNVVMVSASQSVNYWILSINQSISMNLLWQVIVVK